MKYTIWGLKHSVLMSALCLQIILVHLQKTKTSLEDERSEFEPTFDIVQYDATIPDGDDDLGLGDGVPILLADPFSGFIGIDTNDVIAGSTSNRRTNPSSSVIPPPELQLYSVPKLGQQSYI